MDLSRNHSQRNSSWNAPYTFSGKEKDVETGYGYFRALARYYDSGLSIWLSVDPMSDKYPSMSPYNYCANNPVILVDPDGRTFEPSSGTFVGRKEAMGFFSATSISSYFTLYNSSALKIVNSGKEKGKYISKIR
jgi:RHS repeat-associated protein